MNKITPSPDISRSIDRSAVIDASKIKTNNSNEGIKSKMSLRNHSRNMSGSISKSDSFDIIDGIENLTLSTASSSTPHKASYADRSTFNNGIQNRRPSPLKQSNFRQNRISVDDNLFNPVSELNDNDYDDEEQNNSYLNDKLSEDNIPKVTENMTPWKHRKTNSSTNTYIDSSDFRMDSKRAASSYIPSNKTEQYRNSLDLADLRNIVDGDKMDSQNRDINSKEYERMKRTIGSLKMKNKTLIEMIKQINKNNEKDGTKVVQNDKYHSLYNELLKRLDNDDDNLKDLKQENERLQLNVDEKEKHIIAIEQELKKYKEENVEILSSTDEYIKTNDKMTVVADNILGFIKDVDFRTYHIEDIEKHTLETAIGLDSNYFPLKMDTLNGSIRKLIENLQNCENDILSSNEKEKFNARGSIMANSTQLNQMPSDDNGNKTIDPDIEAVVQNLHKEYDNFITSIGNKLKLSLKVEEELKDKLSKQQEIIHKITLMYKEQKSDAVFDEPVNAVPIIVDNGEKSEIEPKLEDSYLSHIESLTVLVQALREKIRDLEVENLEGKNINEENNKMQRQNSLLKRKIENLEEIITQKTENWNDLIAQLETQISELETERDDLVNINHSLDVENKEIGKMKEDIENDIGNLQSDLEYCKKENLELKESNDNLRSTTLQVKASQSNIISRYENDFNKFCHKLLFHLIKVFEILRNIIERNSIDQSIRKVERLSNITELDNLRSLYSKFDTIYNFVEMALESIIQSYTQILIENSTANKRIENNQLSDHPSASDNISILEKVNELQKRWVLERERRKLDSNAAEAKISKLQTENDLLKEQIFKTSLNQ
ncbi:hypothetical protein C6P45_000284 [Maudiozyma exigua]|uniref:Mto2p-binding domain-containing protein n=1 Tax=Maudiozyma exigua TaxID=34358 RepID=A0A9P6W7R8_MAUEX|nr:hypothetical protein C6P45_000284 [Kazachstania exigua]